MTGIHATAAKKKEPPHVSCIGFEKDMSNVEASAEYERSYLGNCWLGIGFVPRRRP
ncbi:unnamed protein product [marine sediment metagenome]|uniref:Uncharacterized protein n=1 Tax=marine sediment metagenome TaxID=412755 RepID=X1BPI7_9ZZZZ